MDGQGRPRNFVSLPVLVVDDDRMFTLAIKRYLERQGIPSVVCHTCAEVLGFEHHEYRAAVLDVNVQGEKDGLRLLQCLRKLVPDLPVIVITGMSSHDVHTSARQAGADYLLTKPFRFSRLCELLERILALPQAEVRDRGMGLLLLAGAAAHQAGIRGLLAGAGYRVLTAASSEEAVLELEVNTALEAVVLLQAPGVDVETVAAQATVVGLGAALMVLAAAGPPPGEYLVGALRALPALLRGRAQALAMAVRPAASSVHEGRA